MPPVDIFGPHDYETYRIHLFRLKEASLREYTPASKAAAMMTTVMMMQRGNGKKTVNRKQYWATRKKLMAQPAFKTMIRDSRAQKALQEGNTDQLFTLLNKFEERRQDSLRRRYGRPKDKDTVKKDAETLGDAISGLREKAGGAAAAAGSPEAERRGKAYVEMMRRLEHAQSLAEQGIQLNAEQTKALITSVKAYNNGGKRSVPPGGETRAPGFTESMVLLQNYMSERDFRGYCRQMNLARGIRDPKNPEYAAPESFKPERLTGAVPARELAAKARRDMQQDFTATTASEALAVHQLSGGNPNSLLRPEEVKQQAEKLRGSSPAFQRVLQQKGTWEELNHLATMGEADEVTNGLNKAIEAEEREIRAESKRSVVRSAQGQINRSILRLTGDTPLNRFHTEQYLANILASEKLAMSAAGDEKITNGAFRERAEELQKDPAFRRLAHRYMNDPRFRARMNEGLQRDRSALTLADAYRAEQGPIGRDRRDMGERIAAAEAHIDAERQAQQAMRQAEPQQVVRPAEPQQVVPTA